MSEGRWNELRGLFDAVCELPSEQWRSELSRLTQDPELLREALELLDAQTHMLERARAPVNGLLTRMSSTELQPGDTLGPWRLTERLASGGMGVVFAAERADAMYDRRVAVKLLRGMADARVVERLAEERQILAGLQHPNIARLYDGGTTAAGLPYLVMEFVDGQALDAYCRHHALPLRARLQLFVRVCRAVQSAHGHLVVHCDLKPGNVLVREDGEPMLLDFGIARLLDASGQGERTDFCTPAYAAPEALTGGAVSVAADVFSLGITLLELLAGRRSQRGVDDHAQPVPQPSAWADPAHSPWQRKLRGDLDAIVGKACAAQPAGRYASAEALADDVQRYLDRRAVVARKGARLYHLRRGLQRNWKASTVAAAAVVLSAAFVWQLGNERAQARHEAQVAEQVSAFLLSAFEAADPRKRGKGETEASARQVLDAGAARIDAELADSPDIRARVQHVIGQAYLNVGVNQRAEELLQAASTSLLTLAVNRPLDAVAALNELSVLLANSDRGGEAEKVARHALALVQAQREGDDAAPQLDDLEARAWNSLGLALADQEQFQPALDAYERSLALRRGTPNAQRSIVSVNHNLGLLYVGWGDLARAEAILRETIAMRRELDGEQSYGVWMTRHVLGLALTQQGRLREADEAQRQNLALALVLFGPESSNTAGVYNELAGINQDLGDYTRSAEYYHRALEVESKASGEDSMDFMLPLNNLATLEEMRGDPAAAIALFERSYAFRQRSLGAEHAGTLRAGANLGRAMMRTGRLAEAKPLLDRALQVWSTRLAPDANDMIITHLGLAEWDLLGRRYDAAAARLQTVAALVQGKSPQLRIRHLSLHARLLQEQGSTAQAAQAWQQVVALAEAEYGADSISTARWRVPWGETLLAGGQRELAQQQATLASAPMQGQVLAGSSLMQRLLRLQAGTARG